MSIDLTKWIVMCDDHYKMFNEYIDDVNLTIYTYTKPTALPVKATQFDTEAEAQNAIDNLSNEDTSLYKVIQLQTLNNNENKRIQEDSDAIIANAWSNTSEERKKEMLDKLRDAKGEQAVTDWLNKYERNNNHE